MSNAQKKANPGNSTERDNILHDVRATFTTESGARVLTMLRQSAGLYTPATVVPARGGTIDPSLTHYRDGRKSIVLEIEAWLRETEDAKPSATRRTPPAPTA